MKTLNHFIKFLKMYLFIFLILFLSCDKENKETPSPYSESSVRIAKWKGNKKAAVVLQFDDSSAGQATLGVPALNERNLVGTWYINPGDYKYDTYRDYWENVAPSGGQELANHTMNHQGGATYEETEYEIGEASRIIWRIRKHKEYGSLIAFNRGGGTSWGSEEDVQKILDKYKNIDRQSYLGVSAHGASIYPGSNATEMFETVPMAIADGTIAGINFHGIAAENGNPPMDGGHAGVWIKEFEAFLDKLVDRKDEIWNAGYIALYKYIKELQTSSISIAEYSNGDLSINLTSEMDVEYYNEPLTIIVQLAKEWKNCIVTHNGSENSYPIKKGVLMFDALPNKGEILLSPGQK